MAGASKSYISYLLRMWRASRDDQSEWRASAESVQTGEIETFADLEALFTFLRVQAGGRLQADPERERPHEPGADAASL